MDALGYPISGCLIPQRKGFKEILPRKVAFINQGR